MYSSTHESLADALKQVRLEKPKQLAITEGFDETGTIVWVYSRPVSYMKESKSTK